MFKFAGLVLIPAVRLWTTEGKQVRRKKDQEVEWVGGLGKDLRNEGLTISRYYVTTKMRTE